MICEQENQIRVLSRWFENISDDNLDFDAHLQTPLDAIHWPLVRTRAIKRRYLVSYDVDLNEIKPPIPTFTKEMHNFFSAIILHF